jgi:putative peptide zinc metalloprotease protein
VTATAQPPAAAVAAPSAAPLGRAEGVELLGPVHGSGYRDGAGLVRRGDGQMVHLGPLMYAMLECVDGTRDGEALAAALSERLDRRVGTKHIQALAQKLAAQGLLAGTEHKAPPRRNPLLALRWKVLVTNPELTRRLTAPFAILFRPWLMWPILAGFVGVFWFVLIHKGVASATAQAFHSPGLLLLVFVLAVLSAGFHELGHAAACRYGGATPAGMGMGMYMVWPAFYTDVTDSYRLPKRARLRVDLGGLYFNAVVAVVTMGVWLLVRADALLLLIALQLLQMVKQLSPVIRADGYHILSDATGVPDLYSHMGPTLRRLLPGHRHEPSALSGWARALVTAWVLIVVPVLLSLTLSAVILLPRLLTSAWQSGGHILQALPREADHGQVLDILASVMRLLALFLPVVGSALVTQKIGRTVFDKARTWTRGRPVRRAVLAAATAAAVAGLVWALWPAGQYQPVRANQNGTLVGLGELVAAPQSIARPSAPVAPRVQLTPGTHLAVAMIPVGGASKRHPALFVIRGAKGKPPVAVLSYSTPKLPASASSPTATTGGPGATTTTTTTTTTPTTTTAPSATTTTTASTAAAGQGSATPVAATAFPFKLPAAPGPGGTQALAVGTKSGGVTYDVAYTLVTVRDGAPVNQTNSAYALANCQACTTVAVSFQVVLIVGQSNLIAPINAAGALNYNCPACTTTAIADQIVVTLKSQPSPALLAQLETELKKLDALPALGAAGSPAAVASEVGLVQQQIDTQLNQSGLRANSTSTTTTTTPSPPTSSGSSATTSTSTSASPTTAGQSSSAGSSSSAPSSSPSSTGASPGTASTATTTTTAPSSGSASGGTATTPSG